MGLINLIGSAASSAVALDLVYLALWLVWLVRELAWWGMIGVMVAILVSFLADAPTVRALWRTSRQVGRARVPDRRTHHAETESRPSEIATPNRRPA